MTTAILTWLGGRDTGSSSKAIALTALGAMPQGAAGSYPHDGADFGRCYRLLQAAPEARAGLETLGREGGPYWKALVANWDRIEKTYLEEIAGNATSTYDLMTSILSPIEERDRNVVRLGEGISMRFGGPRV